MSVAIVVDSAGLDQLNTLVSRLGAAETEELLTEIGGILAESTRERIYETKTSPDGAPWVPNREGTSILLRTGDHLYGSIAFIATNSEVEVGSNWEYAHVHQFGMTIRPVRAKRLVFRVGGEVWRARSVTIPARPFVGLSDDDEAEVIRLTTDWLGLAAAGGR